MSARCVLALALILVAPGLALRAQEGGAPGREPATAPAAGRIRGQVRWEGRPFAPRPVLWPEGLLDRDPALAAIAREHEVVDRRLLVDETSGGIAGCIVSLPALRLPASEPMRMELVLRDLAFATRVVVLPEGWSLVVKNEDPVPHVLELRREADVLRRFEVAAGTSSEIGRVVGGEHRLVSNRLPFLSARIVPRARTPRIVTDAAGAFDVRGAPAGRHRIEISHETLGFVRREIEVVAGETLELSISQQDFRRPGGPDAIAAFSDRGPTALEVDGLAIPEAALARYAAFFGRRHAGLIVPERLRREQALRRVILPLAAVWSRREEDRARLQPRVNEIQALLESGQDFAAVARRFSDEPEEGRGRPIEARPRELEPVLGEAVFASPPGRVRGPLASPRGLHFLLVEEVRAAEDPADERRRFRHLVLTWEAGLDRARLDGLAAEAAARARVRVVDPKLADLLPPELLR